ncbi:hypothetical protein Scep_023408 [Stephania cephalantha]|uniref:Uncharacterized protein n=1 Tax=Stephania cephalantha TaxID=152367 RepID=A0AAP0F050_9MAGN
MGAAQMMVNDTLTDTAKESSEVFGIRGIVNETSRLAFTSAKHGIVVLFSLFPIAFFSISFHLIVLLLGKEMLSADYDSSTFAKEMVFFFCSVAILLLIYYASFLFDVIFIVHYTSDVYLRKSTSLTELSLRTATTWKKIVISELSFEIAFMHTVLITYLVFCFDLFPEFMSKYLAAKLYCLVLFVVGVNFVYQAVCLILGYVIHILEDCDGGKAWEKSRHLIGARKVRGYLAFLVLQLCAPFSLLLLLQVQIPNFEALISLRAMACLLVVLLSFSQLCIYVLFTVFYLCVPSKTMFYYAMIMDGSYVQIESSV